MKKKLNSIIQATLDPLLRNRVYTARSGLCAGARLRGGYDFLPRKLSREHAFLKGLHLHGKTVYDVGGYIGRLAVFFARQVGEDGRVITFEPNPRNYHAILDHLELNGLRHVSAINVGLGSQPGTLKLAVDDHRPAWGTADPDRIHSIQQRGWKIREVLINVDTLDHLVEVRGLPEPDFLKIDVEGMELDVLKGACETIARFKPQMLIELHKVHKHEITRLLLSQGYRILQVEGNFQITEGNLGQATGHLYAIAG